MEAAAPPVRVHVPVAEAIIMTGYAGEGILGDYDIPIRDPDHWRQVLALIREGDEILIVAEVDERPVIMVPAVVIALHEEVPCIQVVA